MKKTESKWEKILKTAVRKTQKTVSLYQIAKESRVDYASLHRFMSGERNLSLINAERLAGYLGYDLVRK
jgi:transcriptional regulator with XRE-family HTH domain